MYSMKDAVMSHAQKVKHGGSTGEAIEFLELPNSHQYNAAGNLYLSALSIINAAQQSVQLTAFGVGMRASLGKLLVRLGCWLAKVGVN